MTDFNIKTNVELVLIETDIDVSDLKKPKAFVRPDDSVVRLDAVSGAPSLIIAPREFSVELTGATEDTARCTWEAVPKVDGYNIYLKSNGSFVKHNETLIEDTTYDIESLVFGSYEVYATYVLGGEESEPSDIQEFDINVFYEYYRVLIVSDNGSGSFVGTAEVELYSEMGGSSIAPGSGGTASASSTATSSYPAANAFNGNSSLQSSGNGWISGSSSSFPKWIRYQFTEPKTIVGYGIAQHANKTSTVDRSFGEITLQGSNNGTDWDDLDSQDLRGTWTGDEQLQTFELG